MSGFREIFEDYGADYQLTMKRFMGKEEMYLKFLDMLFKDDNLKKLGEAIAVRDLKTAFEAAHTLKGVVGNMGLTPLYDAVCMLVEVLRTGSEDADYDSMYTTIDMEFQRADELRGKLKGR